MNLISRAGRALGKSFWNPPQADKHDPSRRALFGAAAGAAIAGPEVVKAIASGAGKPIAAYGDLVEWNGLIGESIRPFDPHELERVSNLVADAQEKYLLDLRIKSLWQARAHAAAENTPRIKPAAAKLPGLSERFSRERAHRRMA